MKTTAEYSTNGYQMELSSECPKRRATGVITCHFGRRIFLKDRFKENSTTKIRPVFDASAKELQGVSLNKCLHKGPNLIELVSSILLRFREGNIDVISDVMKAFLQINIDKKDNDFLRFLWYDLHGNMITCRHCRVVFRVSCSLFILGAIINLHLDKFIEPATNVNVKFSKSYISKLKESLYVDNCVTSLNNVGELNEFICEAKAAMESGGFDLRRWKYTNDDSSHNPTQVLGIMRDKQLDMIFLKSIDTCDLDLSKIAKRKILSVAHRIFDPLGFVCPVFSALKFYCKRLGPLSARGTRK